MKTAPNYLNPEIPSGLKRVTIPIVEATAESLAGYGHIVSDTDEVEIEIVRWPAQGHREVDPDSGDEGGTTEGLFICEWKGDILYGSNSAVSGHYILGYGTEPKKADEHHTRDPKTLLVWHANYHPDAVSAFFLKRKNRSSFPWLFRETILVPKILCVFISVVTRVYTSIPMYGTREL